MYRVTKALSIGRFVTRERADELLAAGVTHVLNVSDAPSWVMSGSSSFRAVEWMPIADIERIPDALAIRILDALHRLAMQKGAHLYVHCVAGQNRAPTILWLYLIACGCSEEFARTLIETSSPDAIAGHPRLIDSDLVLLARQHGERHYLPLSRGEVIVPFADLA